MEKVSHVTKQIRETSSRNRKESILMQNKDVPGFKDLMYFIYNPYTTTGISDKKMDGVSITYTGEPISLEKAIAYFNEHQTGTLADVTFAWQFVLSQQSKEAQAVAYAMVTKNLTIGVTKVTLNKIYGDTFIPVIGCELGVEYRKVKDKMHGIYISSRKIDGIRRLLVKENGVVTMYSRHGLPDDGLVDIVREAVYLPDNTVYDGELEAIGNFSSNIALRQATSSIANRKGNRTGLTFNIFDVIPLEDFKAGQSQHNALVRKRFIDILFGLWPMDEIEPLKPMEFIKAVPIEAVSADLALHEKIFFRMIEAGEEGLMLIRADSMYKVGKRTNDWVKMKNYAEIFLPVVDVFEGAGKYTGMLGGIKVDYRSNGKITRVGVGSGFTDAERKKYWEDPSLILQKIVRIVCQGESVDSSTGIASINCPIFKGICAPTNKVGEFAPLTGDEAE